MNILQKITDYFRSSAAEAKKVSWPTRQDTIRYSSLVIGLSLAVSAFFALLDYGLTRLVDVGLAARQQTQASAPAASSDQVQVTPTTEPSTDATSGASGIDLKNATPIKVVPIDTKTQK